MNLKNWKVILLLSVVVPIGLLATLRLTTVLQEPQGISETTTLDPTKYKIVRPDNWIWIEDNVSTHYESDIILASGVRIVGLSDATGSIDLFVNATGTLRSGFIHTVNITFWQDYNTSFVSFYPEIESTEQNWGWHMGNLTIIDDVYSTPDDVSRGVGLKAFVTLVDANRSKNVEFNGYVHWFLGGPYNTANLLQVAVEFVYYNGTVYKKVVQPFLLELAPDNNNDFQTAEEIQEGNYTQLYLGHIDPVDYFRIYLEEGQRIRILADASTELQDEPVPMFNVSIYNPQEDFMTENSQFGYIQTIEFTANTAGFWFIKVQEIGNWGFYKLEVNGLS